MRILYLSQYFPPEIGATQIRAYEMSHGLVDAGHHVTVIAEIPNHPSGIIPPEYRGKFYERADLHGIDIVRVWVKTSPVKTFRHRLLFYLSYMLSATLAALFMARGRYDVLYASSPPLFVGGAALIISYLLRVPLVFEVRDLWPESAVTLGELRNPRFIRWATRLEKACYNRAERVVVTAQEIVDRLVERGIPLEKLALVRNGANIELFKRDFETRRLVRARLGLEDKFLVLYAGLHGLAYDLEGVLDVASDLQSEPNIRFLLIGDGPTKERVQQYAYELDLQNVIFLPPHSREQIADFFNAADVSIVPMKEPHIVGTLPIKIYDSMACEVPVIVSAIGEIQLIVENSGAGIATHPCNREQLRKAILRLRADPALRAQLGHNGRRAVESCYSRQAQAQQLVQLLQEVVEIESKDNVTPS